MSFEDWLEETDREIAELKKRNEAKMAKTLAEAKLRNEEDARMKQEQFNKMQKRYNFSIEDARIQIALERLEGLAVDRFRNDDYSAQKSFDDVWWSVLHEVDLYEEGEETEFRSVRSVEATKKWLKSFSHLCTEKVPAEYKAEEVM